MKDQSTSKVTWVGVEVVTNNFELIPSVRNATGINPGEQISYSDVRLQEACNSIRKMHPQLAVNCRAILMARATSLYVVELSPPNPVSITIATPCRNEARLDKKFIELVSRMNAEARRSLLDRKKSMEGEFVNGHGYLDYVAPKRHALAASTHGKVSPRFDELVEATHSCDARDRANAIWLMNFTDNPERAAKLAIELISDEDEGVRNNALRFLGTFSKHISPPDVLTMASTFCTFLKHENFLDRNKAISALHGLMFKNSLKPNELSLECLGLLKNLARTSIAEQIGGFAVQMLKEIEVAP